MKWYEGDIAHAVAMSKNKNAIFVVYVEGKDDKSIDLTSQINQGEISSKLESNTFVSIKIEAGSISHNQFTAIYKTVPVPSLFFIGKNGKPIDIILDSNNSNDLAKRINSVIELHTGISSSASESSTKLLDTFIKSEQETESSSAEPANPESVKCENGVCHIASHSSLDTSTVSSLQAGTSRSSTESSSFLELEKKASADEKLERAKQLVEKQRELKQHEEEEAEKLKELERRKMGKDVQQLQRWQQDQELKNLMAERQRAKNEEKAARDRILAQIAQDKADRASRFSSPPPVAEPTPLTKASTSYKTNVARLQFRLPDGSNDTHDFDSTDTLQEVRNYVALNLNLPYRNYSLSTTFPRREFTEDDNEETLKNLELCPNAVILILPGNSSGAVTPHDAGGFMSIVWFLLSPIISVYEYFRSWFVQPPQNTNSNQPERNKRPGDAADSQILRFFFSRPNKRKPTDSTVIRRQGNSNVHRLSDRTDSDDETNTWNGNSTQQM